MRAQLHELHDRLRFSAVFVTHDQSEALALADRVAIMRAGRFEQIGTPEHVFEEPATEYVAGFIGMSNRLPLVRSEAGWVLAGEVLSGSLTLPGNPSSVAVRLRPEDLHLAPTAADLPSGSMSFAARRSPRSSVVATWTSSSRSAAVASTPGYRARAFGGWARKLELDQPVVAGFDPASAVYYGDDDTRLAGHVDLAAPVAVGT